LNDVLLGKNKSEEGQVFLQKMKGDYYRYIAEYASGGQKNEAAD
jgi:14-3-3 protein epsilon